MAIKPIKAMSELRSNELRSNVIPNKALPGRLYPAYLEALIDKRDELAKIYQELKVRRLDPEIRYGVHGPTFREMGELLEITDIPEITGRNKALPNKALPKG